MLPWPSTVTSTIPPPEAAVIVSRSSFSCISLMRDCIC